MRREAKTKCLECLFAPGIDPSFTRAVAVGNPRGIEHAEKEADEVAEGCSRLIRNSIICWNYLYLARQFVAAGTPEARDMF